MASRGADITACRPTKRVSAFEAVPLHPSATTSGPKLYVFRKRRFHVGYFVAYRRYQARAAEAQNTESRRQHVLVDVGPRTATRTICLIGGMGPLSDASIALQCARSLAAKPGGTRLVVISVPPPRDAPLSMLSHFRCLMAVIAQYVKADQACDCYLASNTAHVAFPLFRLALRVTVPDAVPHDLVAQTTQYLTQKYAGRVDTVVLLTTKVAWRANLYVAGLADIARVVCASASEIDHVQSFVDAGKRGDSAAFKDLVSFINSKTRSSKKRYLVFLGCTDFRFLVSNRQSLRRQVLRHHPRALCVEDSDDVFSKLVINGP